MVSAKIGISWRFWIIVATVGITALFAFPTRAVFESGRALGASLYITPLSENPRSGNNFTVTIRVDSLADPINAVRGSLSFSKERLEIINISKIGSILNLFVEEPNFSNFDGTLKFQGGVPNPGFIGNGGVVLHVIFHAKSPGPTSLVWKGGEVLANDGRGTNILTNLQNLDFFVEEPIQTAAPREPEKEDNQILVILNIVLIILIIIIGFVWGLTFLLKYHDRHAHHHEAAREPETHTYPDHFEDGYGRNQSVPGSDHLTRP